MAEYKTPLQSNLAWGESFQMSKKAPAIAERIWGTLADAQSYIDNVNGSATAGLVIAVINDTNTSNNGAYFVKSVGDGTNAGVLIRLADGGSSTITELVTKLNTLIGSDPSKSVRQIAAEEIASQLVPEDAQEALDTLEEIAAWIQSHPDDVAAMNLKIENLETAVGTPREIIDAATYNALTEDEKAEYTQVDANTYTKDPTGLFEDVETAQSTANTALSTATNAAAAAATAQATADNVASDLSDLSNLVGSEAEYDGDEVITPATGLVARIENIENESENKLENITINGVTGTINNKIAGVTLSASNIDITSNIGPYTVTGEDDQPVTQYRYNPGDDLQNIVTSLDARVAANTSAIAAAVAGGVVAVVAGNGISVDSTVTTQPVVSLRVVPGSSLTVSASGLDLIWIE